jgi:hypothetical protein
MDLLSATALLWAAIRVKESINVFTLWIIFTMIAVISVWLPYPSVFVSGGLGLFFWINALRKKNFSSISFPLIYALLLVFSFGTMFFLGAKSQTNATSWLYTVPFRKHIIKTNDGAYYLYYCVLARYFVPDPSVRQSIGGL